VTNQARMPSVYLPHGGGPAFFMSGPMAEMFQPMAEFLASVDTLLPAPPTAILVVTAHWESPVVTVTGAANPEARIPVVAMSLPAGLDAAAHVAIGEALRPLRDQGVLIMGSGMSYHNLSRFAGGGRDAAAFDEWLDGALAGDAAHRSGRLARWAQAPAGRAAHPREEHLIPLMVASGAGGDAPAAKWWSGLVGDTRVSAWAFN
jgi:aromatic ring-opening dioxygenase catalytic subunit (LigB family)